MKMQTNACTTYFSESIQISVVFLKFRRRDLKWSGRDQQKQISMHTDVDSYTFSSPHKHGHDGKQETIAIHHCLQ
jgi:hypothetical protein